MRRVVAAVACFATLGVVHATQPDGDSVVSRTVSRPHNLHEGFHRTVFCNVYSNTLGIETLQPGVGEYREGSVIVKSKLKERKAKDVELFTVMRKMESGYDKDHGDWEYSVVDGKTHRVVSRDVLNAQE